MPSHIVMHGNQSEQICPILRLDVPRPDGYLLIHAWGDIVSLCLMMTYACALPRTSYCSLVRVESQPKACREPA